jgi:hypothetical protein
MVVWTFVSPNVHSVTDTSGMGLFDSGPRTLVSFFAFGFAAAGRYPYEDTENAGTGTVLVPMSAKPKRGHGSTTFTVTWAAAGPSAGLVYDVQIKRPGQKAFASWQHGVTSLSAAFTADAGNGMYRFRARVRNSGNGAASGYSAAVSIKVS